MKTTTITKIKNGTLTLPKEIRRTLRDTEVILLPFGDGVYIKKISTPSLAELRPKLLKLGKTISKKDLQAAVKWAQQKR